MSVPLGHGKNQLREDTTAILELLELSCGRADRRETVSSDPEINRVQRYRERKQSGHFTMPALLSLRTNRDDDNGGVILVAINQGSR